MKTLLTLSLLGLVVAASYAQSGEFMLVDISPSPDTMRPFTPDPFVLQGPVEATFAGNFIRGMDLTGRTTGFYYATSSLSGSPTGLYRMDGGASTLLAALPFLSAGENGFTLSSDQSELYFTLVGGTPSVRRLFKSTLTGTITEVGQLTDGTVTPSIVALAAGANGTLYGIDDAGDRLMTINPTNALCTPVGPIGVAVGTLTGADFDATGSRLYMSTSSGRTYEINTTTGAAGPLLGQTVSTSSIAAIPNRVLNTITGTVTLEDLVPSPAGKIVKLELIDPVNQTVLETVNVTLGAGGSYSAPVAFGGQAVVAIKGSNWLRKASATLDISTNPTVNASLKNGDFNNDNEVGPADFTGLAAAFGSFLGDPNYSAAADFNGDEEVGPADFTILANNFGEFGD